jgi:NAD(P)-dependent dehydrogenase (short-subunit alcohol dehydrogenase family)
MDLSGRIAIVTGGAVRLGRALALALAQNGARVVVHYGSSGDAAQETVARIQAVSDGIALAADLQNVAQARGVVERAVQHFGQVDILVNSAAIFEPGDIWSTGEADWDRHFAINLKAPFFLSQAFAAHLGRERRGHIVNITDWRAFRPGSDYAAYTLTKAALVTLTHSLAQALAPNIQVNAIAPGLILPPPGQDIRYLEHKAQAIPARRPGSPDEVARAMLYLLQSDFVTGEVIFVTGGEHL